MSPRLLQIARRPPHVEPHRPADGGRPLVPATGTRRRPDPPSRTGAWPWYSARPRDANVVVVFRPQTSEAAFRGGLRSVDARLVDGPTVADAYLVHVPPARRARALTALRANPDVSLAEAVDGEGSP